MTHEELLKAIAPVWDEEKQGVYIPLIDKVLLAHNLGNGPLTWEEGQKFAKAIDAAQPSIDELRVLYLQKEVINAILEEHGGDILDGFIWSSTEDNEFDSCTWFISFYSGGTSSYHRSYHSISRGILDIK